MVRTDTWRSYRSANAEVLVEKTDRVWGSFAVNREGGPGQSDLNDRVVNITVSEVGIFYPFIDTTTRSITEKIFFGNTDRSGARAPP